MNAKRTEENDCFKPNTIINPKITLNIGGTRFYTTLDTLTKDPDCLFSGMFDSDLGGFNTEQDTTLIVMKSIFILF